MVAALLISAGAGLVVGSAVVARHRAQSAADLAALAGAVAMPAGVQAGCTRAAQVVRRLAAGRADCRVDGLDVVVTVEAAPLFGGWSLGSARATARAGPVD